MPKYRMYATKDVGYEAIVEAPNEEEAFLIALGEEDVKPEWFQTDDGHDWTVETVWEEIK